MRKKAARAVSPCGFLLYITFADFKICKSTDKIKYLRLEFCLINGYTYN